MLDDEHEQRMYMHLQIMQPELIWECRVYTNPPFRAGSIPIHITHMHACSRLQRAFYFASISGPALLLSPNKSKACTFHQLVSQIDSLCLM